VKQAVFSEYLGVISTDILLQNLTDTADTMLAFPVISPLQAFRSVFPSGLKQMAEVEMSVPGSVEEQQGAFEQFQSRIAKTCTPEEKREAMTPPERKLVGPPLVSLDVGKARS
jgi:hypothetical protein